MLAVYEIVIMSQCTYRCVVLPDATLFVVPASLRLSQCTYRCVVLPDCFSLGKGGWRFIPSQCTYRCVVLPDLRTLSVMHEVSSRVSMHLQVRGAP